MPVGNGASSTSGSVSDTATLDARPSWQLGAVIRRESDDRSTQTAGAEVVVTRGRIRHKQFIARHRTVETACQTIQPQGTRTMSILCSTTRPFASDSAISRRAPN